MSGLRSKTIKSVCLAATMLSACATAKPPHYDPAHFVLPPQTIDDREVFFRRFCEKLKAQGDAECEKYIYAPPATDVRRTSQNKRTIALEQGQRVVVAFALGMFGQCVEDLATPFSDDYGQMRQAGLTVIVAHTEGRSSAERNAEILDRQFSKEIGPTDRVVLVGYSKGTTDLLQALTTYANHDWVRKTIVLVSVDGVVQGTQVADKFVALYGDLQKVFDPKFCPEGDGRALDSMTYDTRRAWMMGHQLPEHIQYYSVASIAQNNEVNPFLLPFFHVLKKTSASNDGQVIVADSILPASHVLAVLKGDHWAIALPFESSQEPRARILSVHNHFPRAAFIETVLDQVVRGLEK